MVTVMKAYSYFSFATRRLPCFPISRAPQLSVEALVMLVFLFVHNASAQEWDVQPGISVGSIYSDNIRLRSDNEDSELVFSINPFVNVKREGRRANVALQYRLQGLIYTDNGDANEVFHQLAASLESELIDEKFFLDLGVDYYQSVIDPDRAVPLQSYQVSGNRSDVLQANARPRFVQSIGSFARFEAAYEIGIQEYQDSGFTGSPIEDLMSYRGTARLSNSGEQARFNWSASYEQERTEYDLFPEFEFESAELEIGYLVSQAVRLIVAGGAESDMFLDPRTANLDGDFWEGGFRWQPRAGTYLELRAGDRYFGDTISGSLAYERGSITVSMNYGESASTTGRDRLRYRYSLGHDDLIEGLAPLTPEIFIGKRFTSRVSYRRPRNDVSLSIYNSRRQYLTGGAEEKDHGISGDWEWRIGPRTAMQSRLAWYRVGFRSSERNDEISQLAIGVERRFRPELSGSFTYRYTRRDSDSGSGSNEYQENAIQLFVTRLF